MAHAVFLSDEDAGLFAETGTAIAHCPISNVFFSNGVLPAAFPQKGIDIGLGMTYPAASRRVYTTTSDKRSSLRGCGRGVDSALPAAERLAYRNPHFRQRSIFTMRLPAVDRVWACRSDAWKSYIWDVQVMTSTLMPNCLYSCGDFHRRSAAQDSLFEPSGKYPRGLGPGQNACINGRNPCIRYFDTSRAECPILSGYRTTWLIICRCFFHIDS